MKLLKRDRARLISILNELERGQRYIREDGTLVCMRKNFKSTTLDFTNDQGEICCSVNKEIGSELALLHSGISELRAVLFPEN